MLLHPNILHWAWGGRKTALFLAEKLPLQKKKKDGKRRLQKTPKPQCQSSRAPQNQP